MKRISTPPFSSHQNYIGQETFSLEKWSLAKYLLDPFTPASLFPVPPPPANADTIPMATPIPTLQYSAAPMLPRRRRPVQKSDLVAASTAEDDF